MKNYILIGIVLVLCVLPVVTAEQQIAKLGTFKQGECVQLMQTCANCTYVSISSVLYPNSTIALGDTSMSKSGIEYTYSFCSTNVTGSYIVNGYGDIDGVVDIFSYTFEVTPLGTSQAGDAFTIFIWILFIITVIGLMITLFLSIAKLATGSETIYGVLLSWGFYVLLIVVSYLGKNFLTYSFINEITNVLLTACLWANAILPVVGMIITIFYKSFKKKNVMSINEILGKRILEGNNG
jgi:hypothetical protein